MNLAKKVMWNKISANLLSCIFFVSACYFAKNDYINVLFKKIKSIHFMCFHWKFCLNWFYKEKEAHLICHGDQNSTDYLGNSSQELFVLEIDSKLTLTETSGLVLSCTWHYNQLHFCL